jgi:Tol biopolymer transport system component
VLAALAAAAPAAAQVPDFQVRTHPFTFGQAPDWMPDGKHVVWHDNLGPEQGIQVVITRLDGSNRRCVTCGQPGPNMVATPRPQGDRIMFHSSRGKNITVGAPGFGGLGSRIWVVRPDGSDPAPLTSPLEGHDDFHAYWSPDGRRIVWTHLNWNFVEDNGDGRSDIRVADYVEDENGPRLENVRVVRPANGHWYETQWWAPDGSGFLYTESVDSSINNELFFMDLTGPEPRPVRLTDDPAWDEQAIFTPDMKKVIFMSTRDHPGAFQTWTAVASGLGIPADYDYLTILPVFEATFLQPVFQQANDLYELDLATRRVRRLTDDGDDGWIIPEFSWDPAGRRLLWTELKWRDELRVDGSLDPAEEAAQALNLAEDPPRFSPNDLEKGGQNSNLSRRTRIGRYVRRR